MATRERKHGNEIWHRDASDNPQPTGDDDPLPVTIQEVDFQVGAIEIKDSDSDDRAIVRIASSIAESDLLLATHDPTVGLLADTAVEGDNTGSLSAKLRGLNKSTGTTADASSASGNASVIALLKRLRAIFNDIWDDTANALRITQETHDELNANATLQVEDADVTETARLPVADVPADTSNTQTPDTLTVTDDGTLQTLHTTTAGKTCVVRAIEMTGTETNGSAIQVTVKIGTKTIAILDIGPGGVLSPEVVRGRSGDSTGDNLTVQHDTASGEVKYSAVVDEV